MVYTCRKHKQFNSMGGASGRRLNVVSSLPKKWSDFVAKARRFIFDIAKYGGIEDADIYSKTMRLKFLQPSLTMFRLKKQRGTALNIGIQVFDRPAQEPGVFISLDVFD